MADKSQSFRDVFVWHKIHAFTLAVHRASELFPKHELLALTSRLQRSAACIPANLANGFRKRTTSDKLKSHNLTRGCTDTTTLQADREEISRLRQGDINGLGRNSS